MNYKETSDIWRLYRREWVIVHTVDGEGDPNHAVPAYPVYKAAKQWADDNLIGRVRLQDIQLIMNSDGTNRYWCHIQIFKDNLKGEFKHVETAQFYATHSGYEEYTIVPRNSKSDHNIRNYGVVKL